jgi:hypothetical protein
MENENNELGFTWWKVWAWIGLTLGNLTLFLQLQEVMPLAITLIVINTILNVMILKFNKYVFLIATILSINPIFWIINGIYLKNRWNHPKVNKVSGQMATQDGS